MERKKDFVKGSLIPDSNNLTASLGCDWNYSQTSMLGIIGRNTSQNGGMVVKVMCVCTCECVCWLRCSQRVMGRTPPGTSLEKIIRQDPQRRWMSVLQAAGTSLVSFPGIGPPD